MVVKAAANDQMKALARCALSTTRPIKAGIIFEKNISKEELCMGKVHKSRKVKPYRQDGSTLKVFQLAR